ncbi:hypothetical protein [Mixta mediterraneensis]|nr:hypothetical protein [Mixta mediterraneensis]
MDTPLLNRLSALDKPCYYWPGQNENARAVIKAVQSTQSSAIKRV